MTAHHAKFAYRRSPFGTEQHFTCSCGVQGPWRLVMRLVIRDLGAHQLAEREPVAS